MHPRTQELIAYLNTRRASLREAVDAVPEALRGTSPDADRWSVAQVIEHLALVEVRFQKMLADRLAEAREKGLAPERETSSIVGSVDVAPILDRTTKHQAPEVVRPTTSDWKRAWSQLEEARRGFIGVFESGEGLALGEVIHTHPRLGAMNLYQWGVWLGGHEARHTEQIHEIGASLKSEV
jgi:DinB family protein